MDNTSTNLPNDPPAAPTNGITPPPTTPTFTDPTSSMPATASWPTPSPMPSTPTVDPLYAPASPTWASPTSEPPAGSVSPFPDLNSPLPPATNLSTWPATPPTPVEPTPITNQQPSSLPTFDPGLATSPLDNPLGAPIQPPPIDGSLQNSQPTWTPPPINLDASAPGIPPAEPTSVSSDSIPTDLSHLISNNPLTGQSNTGAEGLPPTSAETLVVPQSTATDLPTVPTQAHKSIPKWLIGVGIGLLIMVAGASAYFILGVGQSPKTTASIPAEVTPKQVVKTPPPIATPLPQTNPATATDSASFGQLQGNETATPQASSAAELLKQRQQQAQ